MPMKSLKKIGRTGLLLATFLLSITTPLRAEDAPMDKETPPVAGQGPGALSKFESPLQFGMDIQYSPAKYQNYLFTDTVASATRGYGLLVNFEWLALINYGKLALGVGLGATVLSNIVVANDPTQGDQYATLYAFPGSVYVAYRFDYLGPKQVLVPFVKAGASVALTNQRSKFGYAKPGLQPYFGLDYGFGAELCINWIDPSSARSFDRSVGVNATYLTAEYIQSSSLKDTGAQPDLSGSQVRLGLRFEF
jgi:hypothetical protein